METRSAGDPDMHQGLESNIGPEAGFRFVRKRMEGIQGPKEKRKTNL